MKGANKLFIFAGVALALVAVLIGITMSSGNKVDGQVDTTAPSKVKVVKAVVDLEPYTVISMADVEVVEMASDEAPAGAASDVASVINQAYTIRAATGDILLSSFLQIPGITSSIEAGKRAFALEVDDSGLMAGLIMDGDYVDIVFEARVDLRRVTQSNIGAEIEEDGPYAFKEIDADASTEDENQQFQGSDGSEFTVVDGGQSLEPVAKLLLQDIKVIRVVAPGVQYDAQGQQIQQGADVSAVDAAGLGLLILEVTPQQAEALAFMDDLNHSIEVTVRGLDDHEVATTTGITFQILMTDGTWSMPWPKPIFAPGGEDFPGGNAPAESESEEAPDSGS